MPRLYTATRDFYASLFLQPGRRLEASVAEAVRSQERASLEAKLSEA